MMARTAPIGATRRRAVIRGSEPARAAMARRRPRAAPIHHVATTPQARAISVSEWLPMIFGWATVKYSGQRRMVIWSWMRP